MAECITSNKKLKITKKYLNKNNKFQIKFTGKKNNLCNHQLTPALDEIDHMHSRRKKIDPKKIYAENFQR